jgi:LuxR family maltose regulon positive regulatory protein
LVLASKDESSIVVGSPAWFAWLETATTFAFTCPSGRFTARKEARARGGLYWKAYRTTNRTLHRAYLGKTSDLTLNLLLNTAARLTAAQSVPTPATQALPLAASPATVQTASPASPPNLNLLATKLIVPPARAQLVLRPRLFERLEAGLRGKLTLIAAPAGFGKTTLVSAWRATHAGSRIPFAWVSLDSKDSDPFLIWRYVLAALDAVAPGVARSTLALLQSPLPLPGETFLTVLLNEIATGPNIPDNFVLALDDYHVIDNKAISEALAFLLEHLPARMHVVIITREDPGLPLARFRARDQLTELRAGDLRFTLSEAARFLKEVMGLDLSVDDIVALETRTEGWVAGLQLAALALRDRSDRAGFVRTFTGSNRFIIDYLAEEVLERQSEEVRTFLQHTSILERMCAPLCDEVLNINLNQDSEPRLPQLLTSQLSSQPMLEKLERANLFIVPLDNQRQWYRYHHLFADLLRQRLHQSAQHFTRSGGDRRESAAELHLRASQWYEKKGLQIEAFQHAAAAGDVERAARLIEGEGIPRHFRGTVTTILDWLESLPAAVLNARPALWWRYASLLLVNGQTSGVEEKLQAAEAALQDTRAGGKTRNLIGQIAAVRAVLAITRYQVEPMFTQSRRALDYLPPHNLALRATANWTLGVAYQHEGDRAAASLAFAESISLSQTCGDIFTTIMATIGLGDMQVAGNQLHLAAETFQRVLQLLGDQPLPVACEAHLDLAQINYEWNDLDTAERHGRQSLQLARQFGPAIDRFVICEVFLARLKLAQGDVTGASTILVEALQSARERNFGQRVSEIAAVQVLALLRQGKVAAAAQLALAHDLPLSQARVHLAQGDPSAALAVLEKMRQLSEAKGWQDERLIIMVLQAVALYAHGEKDRAVQLLGEALVLAEPGGFIRIFVDEGTPMCQLLTEAAARGMMPDYIEKLLAVFESEKPRTEEKSYLPPGASSAHAAAASPLIEPLSQREIEVLQLMAQGLSNHEISQRLFLALSTVKGHNRLIFGKLQVRRRTEAVALGRKLGLLGLG